MNEEKPAKYSAFIHLSVEILQAASDMIEQVGRLKGIRSASEDGQTHEPYQMDALREAIKKASEALAGYDACHKAGLFEVSNEGFRRLIKSKVFA